MHLRRFGDLAFRLMGLSLICTGLFTTCGQTVTADDLSSEPYSVFVAREKTFARCGPSDEYYRTDALRHGQQLDVYLETDDGWLGVRPPESSFCWLPASAVEIAKGGQRATVSEDRTVCWIGTHLGRARQYRWQVQLAEGEEVTILGRSQRDGPDGPQTWLRIVPPSGEFRWVHRDQIVETAEELIATVRKRTQRGSDPKPATNQVSENKRDRPKNGLDAIAQTAASIKNVVTGNQEVEGDMGPRPAPVEIPNRQAKLAVTNDVPDLKEAPKPSSQPSSQPIRQSTPAVVGSGVPSATTVANNPPPAPQQTAPRQLAPAQPAQIETIATPQPQPVAPPVADAGDVASTEFIGRPRLLDIGAQTSAPQNNVAAADSNWVIGVGRLGRDGSSVQPAAFTQRGAVAAATNTVAAENIQQVAAQVRDAGVDQLQLLLSRLMARGATAAETEPVVTRARNLALTSRDPVASGRARLVAERAEQYQRVARRRDGSTVIREVGIPTIPSGGTVAQAAATVPATATSSGGDIKTGFLVQVYSSRADSPPFALTDHAGNTIAYVTPIPGVNLRSHLNSRVKVIGRKGFLRGLNMPHLMVSQAVRAAE